MPQTYNNLGVLYNKKGDRVKAEESLIKAIELNYGYVEAYCNLGNLYLDEGKKEKAEKMFAEARKYNPAILDTKDVQPLNAETAEKSA